MTNPYCLIKSVQKLEEIKKRKQLEKDKSNKNNIKRQDKGNSSR